MSTTQQYRRIGIDPGRNPAILDTATWEPQRAWQAVQAEGDTWRLTQAALRSGTEIPSSLGVQVVAPSAVHRGAAAFCLASLPDRQQVIVEIGHGGGSQTLGRPLGMMRLSDGLEVAAYPTDAGVVDRYTRILAPHKGPRHLGATPRLGIGCRMTTTVWPAIFEAMNTHHFAANPIQNSVRELSLLPDILAGLPPERNYACGFGTIESGYTGSTYEGLWLAGTLAGLGSAAPLNYGADADHLQVKRGPEGLARARRLIHAARYYTFFTMDMADILHYEALTSSADVHFMDRAIEDAVERRAVLSDHRAPFSAGGVTYRLSDEWISRFAAKYWDALQALEDLGSEISSLKDGQTFDLEFTIDEHPPEVAAFDCLTSPEELLFLLREIVRRGLPITHIAPNYGAEKGWDYRGADGLEGLERRVVALQSLATAFGMMLDFHSADDLTAPTRATLRRATGGWMHYKVSPMLQLIFAEVLQEHHPDLFLRWWDDAVEYARREAEAGSEFAAECLRAYQTAADSTPSRHHQVFHHYGFAYVGRRNSQGQLPFREEFYTLSPAFYAAHHRRISDYAGTLALELFGE